MRFPPVKQVLHQRQRFFLNPFAAAIGAKVFRLQLVQRIDVLLIDNLPLPLLVVKLNEALERLAQPFPGDRLQDVVEGPVANGQAAGFHVAGGGNKDNRAVGACQQRVGHQRHPLTVG